MLAVALGAMVSMAAGGLPAEGPTLLLEPTPLELSLWVELDRLEAARPALGWPIALTSTGGGLVLGGLGLVLGSIVAFPRAPDSLLPLEGAPFAIAGLITLGAGVLLVVVAGEKLLDVLGQRRGLDAQAAEVRRQLQAAVRGRPPSAPASLPSDAPTRARLPPAPVP